MCDVFAARPVASFASDVPFGDLFGANVVGNGVTTVARGARRTLHVVRWIIGGPPICSGVWHMVRTPLSIAYVPLSRKRIVVISYSRKVALLPLAAINKCNLVLGKPCDGIGAEIRDDCIWMLMRIAHDIRHRCLLPTVIDILVAFLTGRRANIVC